VMTPWQGRIIVTLNFDPESLRMIPNTDASILEKLFLLKAGDRKVQFKSQPEMEKLLVVELPWLLRWLLDWTPPAHCYEGADVRFGLAPYAEPSILRAANLSTGKTVFIEILSRWLKDYFTEVKPSATHWEGTATDLRMAMTANAVYAELLRGYRPEEIPKMLVNAMSREVMRIEISDDTSTLRRFKIYREDEPKTLTETVPQTVNSSFQKV